MNRIEEIKKRLNIALEWDDYSKEENRTTDFFSFEDIEYLLDLYEKTEKDRIDLYNRLDLSNLIRSSQGVSIDQVFQENLKLKTALTFYADDKNWLDCSPKDKTTNSYDKYKINDGKFCGGKIAREALNVQD